MENSAREDGRHAEKGLTSNDLVPRFERMDQAGHYCCITTGDRSGKISYVSFITQTNLVTFNVS